MEANRGQYGSREEAANPGTAKPFMPSYRWMGYQSVDDEVRPEYPPSSAFETTTENETAPARLPWRPFYLRRLVIASFIVTLVLILAAIEALLAISNKNDGIATSIHERHYLWTYGPTALLTLFAALWARAEYQSKLVAPWRRLMQQQPMDAKRTLLLDYVSDFQILVVFKALRNKDWTVSIACTVSLLIKILIVISTGLITLSWTVSTSLSNMLSNYKHEEVQSTSSLQPRRWPGCCSSTDLPEN